MFLVEKFCGTIRLAVDRYFTLRNVFSTTSSIMSRKRIKLSEQVRQAIEDAPVSRYQISKQTKISQATLSHFMSGRRGLPMKTLDVLADFLDLNITVGKKSATDRKTINKKN